jgi:ATP-dependent Clp protease ATP-binding subunit ClpB
LERELEKKLRISGPGTEAEKQAIKRVQSLREEIEKCRHEIDSGGARLRPEPCRRIAARAPPRIGAKASIRRGMVRIDMSEYMEKHTVARLIGAPPGYVGYEEGGQLTEAVRRKPYSVILFDEIEKAHHDVFGVLLQIFDDGRLTDGQGRTVDFKNTVIIMTSNIGSHYLMEGATDRGEIKEAAKEQVMGELRRHFRPEFLNRVDDIVLFKPLTVEEVEQIVDLLVKDLSKRLQDRRLSIEITEKARKYIADTGYDPVYGARPLRRYIQRELETRIGREIIKGNVLEGAVIRVDAAEGTLAVTYRNAEEAEAA